MFSSLALNVCLVLALLLGAPRALVNTSSRSYLPLASNAGVASPTPDVSSGARPKITTPTPTKPAAATAPAPTATPNQPAPTTAPTSPSAVTVSFQNGVAPSASYSGGDDTYASQSATATNYGGASSCITDGDDPAGTGRDLSCLLRWDLSSIPTGSTVTSASITLDVINPSVNSYPVYKVLRPWREAEATWSAYAAGQAWSVAGALGSLDRASTSLGAVAGSATGFRTFTLNAAGLTAVQSWISNPGSNYGIILADSNMSDGMDFISNESATASQRPRLTVQYLSAGSSPTATAPAPTSAPTQPPAATSTRTNTPTPGPTATPASTAVPPTATPTRTAVPPTATPTRTAVPTAAPTAVPPTPSGACSLLGQPTSGPYCFGMIGTDSTRNGAEYNAGVRYKLFTLRWREYAPSEGTIDANYVSRKQTELAQMRQAGIQPILSLGVHDPPDWPHTNYPNSYYVDQFGDQYVDGLDTGDVNLVFNPTMRSLATSYVQSVLATFGTNFAAIRLGGGRYGELTYPPAAFGGKSNLYWSFDANTRAKSPFPNWHPGDPSPNGEAKAFLRYHLDSLIEFQNWQISMMRQLGYQGLLMMLYPSWGMRPGDFDKAVATNLNGSSSAESNGETERGFDFQGQIASITDPKVIVTCTWMDADASQDGGTDQRYWSPIHYLTSLAQSHPLKLSAFGENTGQGNRAKMDLTASQMKRYRVTGMLWYCEGEVFSGSYATITDYQQVISSHQP